MSNFKYLKQRLLNRQWMLLCLVLWMALSKAVAAVTPVFDRVVIDNAVVNGFSCDTTGGAPDAVALGSVNELLYPATWHTGLVDFNSVKDATSSGTGAFIDSSAGSMCLGKSVLKQLQYYLGDTTRYSTFVNSTVSGRADDGDGIVSRIIETEDGADGSVSVGFATGMKLQFNGSISGSGVKVLTVSSLDDVKPIDALWFSEGLANSRNKKRSRFSYVYEQSLRVDNIFSPITESQIFVDLLGTPAGAAVPQGWTDALPYLARINLLDSYYDETTRALVSDPKVYFQCEFSTCPTSGRGKWFDKDGRSYNLGVGNITKPKENSNSSDLKLHFLYTGQGNCVVLECPDPNKALVVDCGAKGSDNNRRAFIKDPKGKFKPQPRGTLEAINVLKDKTDIDLVITHGDADHFNKLDAIFYTSNLTSSPLYDRVNNIYFGGDYDAAFPSSNPAQRPKVFKEKFDKATERGTTKIYANSGLGLTGTSSKATDSMGKTTLASCGSGTGDPTIRAVAVNDHPEDNKDKNANSIVLHIEYKGKTIVLPGDAEMDALLRSIGYRRCSSGAGCTQNSLGNNSKNLKYEYAPPPGEPVIGLTAGKANIDILAVPHHGAVTFGSNNQFWINAMDPKYLVYSHGNTSHGHPYGASYFATQYDGSLYKTAVAGSTPDRSSNVTALATEAYSGSDAVPALWPTIAGDYGYFHQNSYLANNTITPHIMRFNSSKTSRIYAGGETTTNREYGKRRLVNSRVYSTEQLGSHTFTISDNGSGGGVIGVTCNGMFNAEDRGRADVVNSDLCSRAP